MFAPALFLFFASTHRFWDKEFRRRGKIKMRIITVGACAALFCIPATGVSAGAFTDDMSRCLVTKSTTDDQTTFIEWMFSAIAAHPAVRSLSNVSDSQRDELTNKVAQLMMRLVTVDCRQQTVAALKYEGASAFGSAFQLLGEAAMEGLIKDPVVSQRFEALQKSVDEAKLTDLFKEAGLPLTQAK